MEEILPCQQNECRILKKSIPVEIQYEAILDILRDQRLERWTALYTGTPIKQASTDAKAVHSS